VTDHLAFGAAMAAETRKVPWATVAVTPLVVSRPLARAVSALILSPMVNRMRADAGLPRKSGSLESFYSPELLLAQGVPELEPGIDLPSQVRFVGRLITPPSRTELPEWWSDLDGRTVVHVTQGTLETDVDDLLKPAIEALAGHDALVVCTTGGAAWEGPLPSNVRMAPFIPHDLLLARTDVMITNGGWGGVLAAIEAGVPLVVVPGSLDKPQVAQRVARSGAGVVLRKPKRLGEAVDEVLSRPRHRVRELGRAITAAGGAARAADLVEELVRRR
jgi:UDP:flavonoid glycosyltransferase YjiC (YdhE family)